MSTLSIPGFKVLETLRETSKTVSVKAVQHSLDRLVVLTFLRPELAGNPGEVARFLTIARTCAQLKADGLPKIFDIVSTDAHQYIVMEKVDGPTVDELVSRNGPLPATHAAQLGFVIAEALNCAWQHGRLVCRDLKPSEICIDSRGVAKLIDFHRAAVVSADGRIVDDEDAGMIVGTPNFLSPEQIRGDAPLDYRTDMYALGATLYFMVTGQFPFQENDPETVLQRQVSGQIPHPRTVRPDLPSTMSGLIARLMMKQPDDRYASWAEAMGDLQHVLKNLPLRRRETPARGISTVAAPPADVPAPEAPRLRRATSPATGALPTPAAAAQIPAAARPIWRGPPRSVRLVLWMLLAVWLAFLTNDRLGNPADLPRSWRLDTWLANLQTTPQATPQATPAGAPPAAPVAAASAAAPAATEIPAPAAPAVAPATAATPAPPAATPPPATLPPQAVTKLAEAFTRNDLDAARAVLAGDLGLDAARLAVFRDAVQAIPDPLRLAEETLLKSRDQEITITYMGKERRIIPHRVINGEIAADYVAADGNRPVTFKTARFTPDELVKLLPSDPETPAAQAAVCLALLQAGHRDDVAQHSAKCGPLAPVFEAAAR